LVVPQGDNCVIVASKNMAKANVTFAPGRLLYANARMAGKGCAVDSQDLAGKT
jgi:hypothetical protein